MATTKRGHFCLFSLQQSAQAIISSIHHQANCKYAQNYHQGHNFIRKERENTGFNKKPILFPIIDCVAKGRPNQDTQDAAKFLPYLTEFQFHCPCGQVQKAPAEQKAMVHKGLEDEIAKWWLAAKGAARITHPHQAGGDRQNDHRLFDFRELRIKLHERHEHRHNGADIERQLVDADTVVAVRERHNEEIDHVETDREICHNIMYAFFSVREFLTD